jgi:hypothetical protein
MRHGSRLSMPMTPFDATAAMSASEGAAIDADSSECRGDFAGARSRASKGCHNCRKL